MVECGMGKLFKKRRAKQRAAAITRFQRERRKDKLAARQQASADKTPWHPPGKAIPLALVGSLAIEVVAAAWHPVTLSPQPHREVEFPELPTTTVPVSVSGNSTNVAAVLTGYSYPNWKK